MKKTWRIVLFLLSVLLAFVFLGPQPAPFEPTTEWLPAPSRGELDTWLARREARYSLRENNEAQIRWYADTGRATEFVVLYLHGFSASQGEGAPVHQNIAQRLGANLFLARLAGHGLDTTQQLATFTAEAAWHDARQALALAHELGEKVIIMSTSTGGTLALQLAATFPDKVHALINLSPNLAIADPAARLLDGPWGLAIARAVIGEKRYVNQRPNQAYRYWDSLYTVQALVELQRLLSGTMSKQTFTAIQCPVLTLYYYRDEDHHDNIVDITEIPKAQALFATPDSLKRALALSEPGDHVLASPVKSQNVEVVEEAIVDFLKNILRLPIR